jgi:hypothetical protein
LGAVVRSSKDFWLGIIYLMVGAGGFWIARNYSFGSGARMGPGYFPTIISSLLFVFGIISLVRAFLLQGQTPPGAVAWRALALVIGSAVVFALLLEKVGFVVAALVLLFMCAIASSLFRFSWIAALGAIALVGACALVFITGLGVLMPTVGPWILSFVPTGLGQ